MKFMNLGRSGLSVSRLCLGTMNFGPETDEASAHAIMDAALANGINFFDTANRYGAPQHGRTEEIMGRWFAKGGGRREGGAGHQAVWRDGCVAQQQVAVGA